MRVLVAEDEPIALRLLAARLQRWGYEVVVAEDGAEAWRLLQAADAPHLAILDWLMPGVDGVEICRRVRAREQAPYTYILLLTARDSQEDVIAGLDAGADDYLTKPFDPQELQVRLRSGTRIVDLEGALRTSLSELEAARRREAGVGARIQQALLLGQVPRHVPGVSVAALSVPSQQIDGDFYDFHVHDDRRFDVIVGDVMGKGVPAALVAAAVKSEFLRALSRLCTHSARGSLPDPEQIVSMVHQSTTGWFIGLGFYVTLCYARFDLGAGQVTFVDCGHTKTAHYRADAGTVETLEGENLPIGCSLKEVYRQVCKPLGPGDRFLFYSDGVTEARNAQGELFGEQRLLDLVLANAEQTTAALVEATREAAIQFSGSATFADDLTCVAVEIQTAGPADAEVHAELDVTSSLSELVRVRAFVEGFCNRFVAVAEHADASTRMVLAADETFTNIIRHAYHGRAGQPIQVVADYAAGTLSLHFRHDGDAFVDRDERAPVLDGSRDGGFGLHIMRHCVDQVRYAQGDDGSNSILLMKRLGPEPPHGPEH